MDSKKSEWKYYCVLTGILLIVEIFIGAFVPHTKWLRSYGGDILVIPLIYSIIRIFTNKLPALLPVLVCGIGFLAEIAQYFHLSDKLGFARGSLMSILIGTSFSWLDIICYFAGMLCIYAGMYLKGVFHHE